LLAGLCFTAPAWADPVAQQAVAEPAQALAEPSPEEVEVQVGLQEYRVEPERPKSDTKGFVDDVNPEANVPVKLKQQNPLQFGYYLMELSGKADEALKEKRYEDAAKYFRAVVIAVPDEAIGFAKLCEAYEALGKLDLAERECREALSLHGATVEHAVRYVRVIRTARPQVGPTDREKIDEVVQHLRKEPGTELVIAQIECELGAQLEDVGRLERCMAVLNARVPNEPATLSYAWALAVAKGNFSDAEAVTLRAEKLGLPSQAIETMRTGLETRRGPIWAARIKLFAVAALVVGGILGLLAFLKRRRVMPSAV